MIIDQIANASLYKDLGAGIAKAFSLIAEGSVTDYDLGRHLLEGDELVAILMEYETKKAHEFVLEAHRKYIDVQYIISGTELIAYEPLKNQKVVKEYDEQNDFILFECTPSLVKLEQGMFAIFFPHDVHAAGITTSASATVRKVVFKVQV